MLHISAKFLRCSLRCKGLSNPCFPADGIDGKKFGAAFALVVADGEHRFERGFGLIPRFATRSVVVECGAVIVGGLYQRIVATGRGHCSRVHKARRLTSLSGGRFLFTQRSLQTCVLPESFRALLSGKS